MLKTKPLPIKTIKHDNNIEQSQIWNTEKENKIWIQPHPRVQKQCTAKTQRFYCLEPRGCLSFYFTIALTTFWLETVESQTVSKAKLLLKQNHVNHFVLWGKL